MTAHVEHFRLTPAYLGDEANRLASICPACKEGVLLVRRDPTTFVLQERDNCILCGSEVIYTDIDEMRRKDWAKA